MSDDDKPVVEPVADAPGLQDEATEDAAFEKLLGKHAKKSRDTEKMEKVREAKGKQLPADAEKSIEKDAEPEPSAEDGTKPAPGPKVHDQEQSPDQEPEKPVEDDKAKKAKLAEDAARFAALSRREKQALETERRAKDTLQQIESQKREIASYAEKLRAREQELAEIRKSPTRLLEWGGYSLDDTVQYVLNDQRPTADMATREVESRVMQELRKLQEQLAERDRREKEHAERAAQEAEVRAVQQFQKDIHSFLRTNADEYELVNANDAHDEVFDLIRLQYEADGTLLEIDEAAKRVEAALEERGRKLLSSKKLGAHLASQTASTPTPSKQAQQTRERNASPKTITNSLVSSPGGSGGDDLLSMDEDSAFDLWVNRTKARMSRRA